MPSGTWWNQKKATPLQLRRNKSQQAMDKIIGVTNNHPTSADGFYDSEKNLSMNIDYSDDDIIIVDSMREIVESSQVRVRMNGILVCMDGTAQAEINNHLVTIKKNQIVLFPPNTMFDNFLFSIDFKFKLLLLTNRIIQQFLRPYIQIWNQVMYVNKMRICDLTDVDMEFANRMYDTIRFCQKYSTNPYRKEVIQSIVQGGLLGLCGMLSLEQEGGENTHRAKGKDVFPRFLELLQNSKVKHRPVADYASDLCITSKYLTMVCKQNSGKTTMQWIEEYTLADIDYYIKKTDKSIKEISNLLGFPNTSFFGKYFKQHFGMSPLRYRNAQGNKAEESG